MNIKFAYLKKYFQRDSLALLTISSVILVSYFSLFLLLFLLFY